MAWCPFAEKLELQPESDAQPAIRPTQMILHSIVAPWTPRRTYEYWRDSSALESHFGVGYPGDVAQYIGTETRADANYQANRRADGTGAISVETASNTSASDPWTAAQVETLIRLGVWAHQRHNIPLRICRTHDDPGFGYHRMFPQWAAGGATACPGNARINQFREVVFPGIVARATDQTTEEDDMALTADDIEKVADKVVAKLFAADVVPAVAPPDENADWHDGNRTWTYKYAVHTPIVTSRETLRRLKGVEEKVNSLSVGGVDLDALAAKVADLLAARLAE